MTPGGVAKKWARGNVWKTPKNARQKLETRISMVIRPILTYMITMDKLDVDSVGKISSWHLKKLNVQVVIKRLWWNIATATDSPNSQNSRKLLGVKSIWARIRTNLIYRQWRFIKIKKNHHTQNFVFNWIFIFYDTSVWCKKMTEIDCHCFDWIFSHILRQMGVLFFINSPIFLWLFHLT